MKRLSIAITSIVTLAAGLCLAADYTQIKQTRSGYQIGTGTNQPVGFFGATPVPRPAGYPALTNTFAAGALTLSTQTNTSVQIALTVSTMTLTNLLEGGSVTNTFPIVTNVAVNVVYGFGSAAPTVTTSNVSINGFAGFQTTTIASNTVSYINAIRAALVNLGLMKATQ